MVHHILTQKCKIKEEWGFLLLVWPRKQGSFYRTTINAEKITHAHWPEGAGQWTKADTVWRKIKTWRRKQQKKRSVFMVFSLRSDYKVSDLKLWWIKKKILCGWMNQRTAFRATTDIGEWVRNLEQGESEWWRPPSLCTHYTQFSAHIRQTHTARIKQRTNWDLNCQPKDTVGSLSPIKLLIIASKNKKHRHSWKDITKFRIYTSYHKVQDTIQDYLTYKKWEKMWPSPPPKKTVDGDQPQRLKSRQRL